MSEASFNSICSVHSDVTNVKKKLEAKRNGDKVYYQFDHEVVILFGHTELKAYVAWKENVSNFQAGLSLDAAYVVWCVIDQGVEKRCVVPTYVLPNFKGTSLPEVQHMLYTIEPYKCY